MKSLLLATFLFISNGAFASDDAREFNCSAKYVFGNKEKATLSGSIVNNSSLRDVIYSIDDQVEFNESTLVKNKDADSGKQKYAYNNEFKVSEGVYILYMPINLENRFTFTAIIGNAKTFEKLECVVEN